MAATNEREIGEQIGELRSDVRGVAGDVKELQRTNAEEHGKNSARLERMEGNLRAALETKADIDWVREHEGRLRIVEGKWLEGKGAVRLIQIAKGILLALVPFAVLLLAKALG